MKRKGKIILNLAVSLDGFIEDENGNFDWCFTDQDYGMEQFIKECSHIIFGRKSFEVLKTVDSKPYSDKTKIILSHSMHDHENIILPEFSKEYFEELKRSASGSIWLFGGAQIITIFLNANLVDELMLAIHPVILGNGKPLFSKDRKSVV